MKNRLLALLLCLVLIASLFAMTACGTKKNSEVTDDEEREIALASFMKGVESIRKGGITVTGTLKGSSTDKDETGALKTENIDLTLSLKYNNEKFVAVAEGTAGDETGKFEFYFDGETVGMLSTEGDKTEGDVYFLEDAAQMLPDSFAFLAEDYSEIIDQVLALIDLDKVAANISAATKDVVSIKTNGKTYTVTVSSDAIFDSVLNTLNILKNSGDKKVSVLIDELAGEGTFAKLQATLEKYDGTDTIASILPDLEAALTDLGIKVDALYAFIGQFMGVTGEDGEDVGVQVKAQLTVALSNMTLNDVVVMLAGKLGLGFGANEPYQSEVPGEVGATGGDDDDEEAALTYEDLVQMILSFADMKVNDLFAMLGAGEGDEPFDIATETAEAIETVSAVKEALKFNLSVTCDKKLNPTSVELTASVDTSKLPADMVDEGEVTKLDLSISAEIKSSVEVAPSTAMAAKIAAAQSAREEGGEEEED